MGCCLLVPHQDAKHKPHYMSHPLTNTRKLQGCKCHLHVRPHTPAGLVTNFEFSRDFNKKYTKGRFLGHGHFGYTYEAVNTRSREKAAVKIIEKKKMVRSIAVEDVRREVKIMKSLSGHKNVVQFFEAFEDDEYVYIVMELCEGGELLDRILSKKDKCYTEKDAAMIVRQMLEVVARCHLHGIVHRDIKPENFLFKSQIDDCPLKITDFGLSDYIIPGKRFRDIVGSPYYIAPEVLQRKSGPESDVWSIGVVTFILLCGRRPFWHKTQNGIYNQVLTGKLEFRERVWRTVSYHAKDLVKKLLVKDPMARLTAAQALSHPWVREGGIAPDIPLDISVLSNMRKFVKHSRLKQIALRALASTLSEEEIANIRDQFNAIDVDKNGTISPEELKEALAKDKTWDIPSSKVDEILKAMDNNKDGKIDFQEFLTATIHVNQFEEINPKKWNIRTSDAFRMIDEDMDGYITPSELEKYTGIKGAVKHLLDEADTNKDGKISLQEFQDLLRQATREP